MIAVTFALPSESSALRRCLGERSIDLDGIIRGKIEDYQVAIVHTGVGRKSCARTLGDFLARAQPVVLISSGFVGGASEELRRGELFLAENFSDPALLQAARARLGQIARVGNLFTAPAMIDSVAERSAVATERGAAAIDMETETIADVCEAHHIPLLSIRVVTDTAAEPFPAPPSVLFDVERQRTNGIALALYFARHPAQIPRLARFAQTIATARETLANAIVSLLPAVVV